MLGALPLSAVSLFFFLVKRMMLKQNPTESTFKGKVCPVSSLRQRQKQLLSPKEICRIIRKQRLGVSLRINMIFCLVAETVTKLR